MKTFTVENTKRKKEKEAGNCRIRKKTRLQIQNIIWKETSFTDVRRRDVAKAKLKMRDTDINELLRVFERPFSRTKKLASRARRFTSD